MTSAATSISFILQKGSCVNQCKKSSVENVQHASVFNCVFVFRFQLPIKTQDTKQSCGFTETVKQNKILTETDASEHLGAACVTPPLRSSNGMTFPYDEMTCVCFLWWLSCLRLNDAKAWKGSPPMTHCVSSLPEPPCERWMMRPFIITVETF